MKGRVGTVANGAWDIYLDRDFSVTDYSVIYHGVSPPIVFETAERIFPGGKLRLVEPFDPARLPMAVRQAPGGGGLGTTASLATWLPARRLTYLDVSEPDETIRRFFASRGVEAWFAGLRLLPRNPIFGQRANKTVLKSPLPPVRLPDEVRETVSRRLADCACIVLNSVKEEELVRIALTRKAANPRCKLAVVLTRSLEPEFVREHLLPHVDILVASFDELGWLLSPMPCTVSASRERLLELLTLMPARASVHITLGSAGVLCGNRDGFFRVRLRSQAARRVADIVSRAPAALTGAGDWFAGGLIASAYSSRWPSVPPFPEIVRGSVAGCIAAVHHLGADTTVEDYEIWEDALSEFRCYSRFAPSPERIPETVGA